MIDKDILEKQYTREGKSMAQIGKCLGCSVHKVKYWMEYYKINRRSISEAIYLKNNPNGDPFFFKKPENKASAILFGIGIGLYWGEGTKADKNSVRLGNTDPKLIKTFIEFLIDCFGIRKRDLKFGLQLFTDVNINEALDFWIKNLRIRQDQFYKPVVTISGAIGAYRKKSRYGVLTVHYHNKKLRDLLMLKLADVAQW